MQGETRKYAWILRLRYGSSVAAAQVLKVGEQSFSNWLNSVCEASRDHFATLKAHAEAIPLVECYQLVMARLQPQKGRQGQRSDLKKTLQPASALVCEEENRVDNFFSQLRPGRDEVVYFSGRMDELIAKFLNLRSKHDVHHIKKVLKDGNPALIGVLNRRELTPGQAVHFIGLPVEVQNSLLQKSRTEQRVGIKTWKIKQEQGGENKKD